jgi:hypothetical protein
MQRHKHQHCILAQPGLVSKILLEIDLDFLIVARLDLKIDLVFVPTSPATNPKKSFL